MANAHGSDQFKLSQITRLKHWNSKAWFLASSTVAEYIFATMKLISSAAVLAFFVAVSLGSIANAAENDESFHLRGLAGKDTKQNTFVSGSVANDGLLERNPCIAFDQLPVGSLENAASDSECLTNACEGGCCRRYNWLICDTTNGHPRLQCVCNAITQDPNSFTASALPEVTVPYAVSSGSSGTAPAPAPGGKNEKKPAGKPK